MLGILEENPDTRRLNTQTLTAEVYIPDTQASTATIASTIVEDSPVVVADKQVLNCVDHRFNNLMTGKLIGVVAKNFSLVNDKSHVKKKVWEMIAEEIQKIGYLTEIDKTKAGEKCHQRWRSLEKMYHNHVKYTKSTGKGKKMEPAFF